MKPDSLGRPTWCMIDFFDSSSPLFSAAFILAPMVANASSHVVRTHLPSPRLVPGARFKGKGMRSGSYICDCTA